MPESPRGGGFGGWGMTLSNYLFFYQKRMSVRIYVSMPRKKTKAKRSRRFRRKNKGPCMSVSRFGPMCDRHRCVLRYTQRLGTGSAVFPLYRFSCNSIYDPDISGVGTQPNGHDQLAAFYNRYVVRFAEIKVRFASASAISRACIAVTNGNYIFANYEELAQCTRAKQRVLPDVTKDTVGRTITMRVDLKKLYGRPSLADDRCQADFGSSPQEAAQFVIGLQNMDGISATSAYLDVEIKYWTECFDMKNVLPES